MPHDIGTFLLGWAIALLLGLAVGYRDGRRRGSVEAYRIGLGDGHDLERLRERGGTVVAMRRARP
jgi:hypothetical protein